MKDDNCLWEAKYVNNVQGFTEVEGRAQANKVFEALDIDKDGKIGMEEFIRVGLKTNNDCEKDANKIIHSNKVPQF